MNWKRISIFVVAGFVATALAAFPFGFMRGFLQSQGRPVPFFVPLGQALAVPTVATIVFARLAFIQRDRSASHVYLCGFLMWVLSFVPNVLVFNQPVTGWILGIAVLAVTTSIGLGGGLLLRALFHSGSGKAG